MPGGPGGTNSVGYFNDNGNLQQPGVSVAYGDPYTTGDIIGVAFDLDVGEITFFKNGVSQGVAPATGLDSGSYMPAVGCYSSSDVSINYGQQPFYTPPDGFEALQTQNLPTPAIPNGRDHFQAITEGGGQGLGTWSEPVTYAINAAVNIGEATSGPSTLPVTPAGQRNWIHDFGFPNSSLILTWQP